MQGGTNPALSVRTLATGGFPVPSAGDAMGVDGSLTASGWGHMSTTTLGLISFTDMRWWARTSCHSRVIHFTTNNTNAISYIKTGTGSFPTPLPVNTYRLMPDHTADIPLSANAVAANQGEKAMTEFVRRVDSSSGRP